MYQMYMWITKDLYEKANNKREKGDFEAYGSVTEQEQYEEYLFNLLSNFKTSKTTGYEGEANISFALIECLKSIDLSLAEKFEIKLNNQYSRYKFTGKTEDICQKYFHYGKEHVENIVQLIESYQNSLSDIDKSELDENIVSVLPTINELLEKDKHSSVEINELIEKLENSNLNLSSFCDDVEKLLKELFLKNLNLELQKTVDENKSEESKVKIMAGQDFNLLIHSSLTPEEFLENTGSNVHSMISTTLIDNRNIRCYQSRCVKFVFYDSLKDEDLISAFSRDASTDFSDDGILTSFSNPDYITIENFKNKSREGEGLSGYSEIMIKGNIRPNAIVCFDEPTDQELMLSIKYNLDIILIETEFYKDMLKDEDSSEMSL